MLSERNTVDNSPGDIRRGWETFQMHGHPYFHRTGEAGYAPSKVHKDYLARLGKRMKRVKTNESGANLARDSSATTRLCFDGDGAQ